MDFGVLNIHQDYGAFVVVRDRESLLHGEGKQVIFIVKLRRYAECRELN